MSHPDPRPGPHAHAWASQAIVLELSSHERQRLLQADRDGFGHGRFDRTRIVYKRCYCGKVLL